jgi:hypothetical protein
MQNTVRAFLQRPTTYETESWRNLYKMSVHKLKRLGSVWYDSSDAVKTGDQLNRFPISSCSWNTQIDSSNKSEMCAWGG